MKIVYLCLLLLCTIASAQDEPLDLNTIEKSDGAWLKYDDGTPGAVTWTGTYRGVWFNMEDFIPGVTGIYVGQAEIWFYHFPENPWDTSSFYCELWNGQSTGPEVRHSKVLSTAVHNTPMYADFIPDPYTDANFWVVVNTEFSSGGWPSLITDEQTLSHQHSFYSDDFIILEPWHEDDIHGDFFIRAYVDWNAIHRTTWGSLKATF